MSDSHTHAWEPVERVELVAGWLALDFANTTSGRESADPHERLHGYDDLVTWCVRAELFGKTEAARLRAMAAARPDEAAMVLARARALREAIWATFAALAESREPSAADVALLNGVLKEGMGRRQLRPSANGFCWAWAEQPDGLDWMLWPLAYSAAELLTSSELARVKECGGEGCDWLFVDVSRNRSRRWCDMKDCGNRAKARRHYRRAKAG